MLGALIRTRLAGLLASLFRGSKTRKKRGLGFKLLMGLFALFVVAMLLLYFGILFSALAGPLHAAGLDWFYFALAGVIAAALGFVLSVFMAQQLLFSAKDNDLLLSMPIPTSYILGSRMLSLLAMSLALTALVMAPAGVVWCREVGASAAGVCRFVLVSLLLPFLIMTVTSLFGWLLALVTSRMRNKTVVTLVLSLAFLGAYFWFCFNLNTALMTLLQNSAAIAGSIQGAVWPAYAFGVAAAGSWGHLGGFAACCVLPFALVYAALSRSFFRVAAARPGAPKLKYREQALRVSSLSRALLARELRRFGANGMYILNAALGSIMTVVAAVLVVVNRGTLLAYAEMFPPGILAGLAAAALGFLCSVDVISAPSVSLEGHSLWILKSLPVPPREILMAKVRLHLVIALPPNLVASLCLVLALPFSGLEIAGLIVLPAALTVFCALLGVVANLHFPKLDYINETAVVKQSMSVLVTMFAGMGAVIAPVLAYVFLLRERLGMGAYLLLLSAVFAAASAAMYAWLGRRGTRRFEAL